MKFFDSHSHYQDEAFKEDRQRILIQEHENDINKIVIPGWDLESSKEAVELAGKYDFIYSAVGIHPSDVNKKQDLEKIYELAQISSKVVAIGEIGLDYHYEDINEHLQKEYFINQIKLANELNKPIIIHTRDAIIDTLKIVKENKINNSGVFHCCPHNIELIKEALKLGYYISFSGTITFKSAEKNAYNAVNAVPLDRILIETDSPYLSPQPYRGQRNSSINVKIVAQKIAEFRNLNLEEVANITYNNAKQLFNISE